MDTRTPIKTNFLRLVGAEQPAHSLLKKELEELSLLHSHMLSTDASEPNGFHDGMRGLKAGHYQAASEQFLRISKESALANYLLGLLHMSGQLVADSKLSPTAHLNMAAKHFRDAYEKDGQVVGGGGAIKYHAKIKLEVMFEWYCKSHDTNSDRWADRWADRVNFKDYRGAFQIVYHFNIIFQGNGLRFLQFVRRDDYNEDKMDYSSLEYSKLREAKYVSERGIDFAYRDNYRDYSVAFNPMPPGEAFNRLAYSELLECLRDYPQDGDRFIDLLDPATAKVFEKLYTDIQDALGCMPNDLISIVMGYQNWPSFATLISEKIKEKARTEAIPRQLQIQVPDSGALPAEHSVDSKGISQQEELESKRQALNNQFSNMTPPRHHEVSLRSRVGRGAAVGGVIGGGTGMAVLAVLIVAGVLVSGPGALTLGAAAAIVVSVMLGSALLGALSGAYYRYSQHRRTVRTYQKMADSINTLDGQINDIKSKPQEAARKSQTNVLKDVSNGFSANLYQDKSENNVGSGSESSRDLSQRSDQPGDGISHSVTSASTSAVHSLSR
jgi:hypothetical protein